MIEYPRPGIWSLGFVTGSMSQEIQAKISAPVLSVFIPTTPNPATGWYVVVPENEVINLSMSIEEAFKIVISGGIVAANPVLAPLIFSPEIPPQKLPESDHNLNKTENPSDEVVV